MLTDTSFCKKKHINKCWNEHILRIINALGLLFIIVITVITFNKTFLKNVTGVSIKRILYF